MIPFSNEYVIYHALLRELRNLKMDGASEDEIAVMQKRVDEAKAALDANSDT